MKPLSLVFCVVVLVVVSAVSASASHLNGQDVPGSLIVVRNGHDYVWAAPCDGDNIPLQGCGASLIYHHGFRLVQAADWLADFVSNADITGAFAAAGNPCASAYFNSGYDHCDVGDALAGFIENSPFPGAQYDPNQESFAIRGAAVPEPATLALLGVGLAGLLIRRRSR